MTSPIVDLWFPVLGETLPSDHGYLLYSALCEECPELHGASWWGLHTIPGTVRGDGRILLQDRPSMGLRLPADRIGTVLSLAGKKLRVGNQSIRCAPPTVRPLESASAVSARIVCIKGFMEPEEFEGAIRRQLNGFGVDCPVQIGPRKVLQIRQHTVVGFSVRISEVDPDQSLELQRQGLGGRRRFGCGMFSPSKHPLLPERQSSKNRDTEMTR